jgi:hypothetical protein
MGTASSLYFNGGYEFGGLTKIGSYAVGADAALLSRKQLTLSFELFGQYLNEGVSEISSTLRGPFISTDPVDPTRYTFERIQFGTGSNNLLDLAIGMKYQLGGASLLTAGIAIPLDNNSLRPKFTPYVGLDVAVGSR